MWERVKERVSSEEKALVQAKKKARWWVITI